MIHKTRQQLWHAKLSYANRLPNFISRHFLVNHIRRVRMLKTGPSLRAALGVLNWALGLARVDGRRAFRAICPLSARFRGTTQRYIVARTKTREIGDAGMLFGLRKSSW